jgi:hypothetical protein
MVATAPCLHITCMGDILMPLPTLATVTGRKARVPS